MPNTHLRPNRIACVLAATALLTVGGATAASAATSPDLPVVGGLLGGGTGGLTDGLLGGSGGLPVVGGLLGGSGGGLPVVGGLLGGSGGLPVVGDVLGGGLPVVGDLDGLPVVGGGALPLGPGALPVGDVLNGVPVVGPLVGGILGGVLDGVTGGGGTTNGGGNTHTGGGNTTNGGHPSHHQQTSSVHKGEHKSQTSRTHHSNADDDTDDGVIPSGGVRAGFGTPVSEGAGGASALPLALLGAVALGSAGLGVRRLISARGAE